MKTRKNKNNFRQTRSKRQRGGTPEQDSQLIDAVQTRDLPRAEALLDAGANIDASRADGSTALMWATTRGYKEIVQMLLERRANVNASASSGDTAILWASFRGYEEIVQMLLAKGANVNASNSTGHTALFIASISGYEEIVRMLLAKGANVDDSGVDGKTALIWASIRGNKEIVRMLLDAGANVNASGVDGKTALTMARQMRNQEIVQMIETHIERKKDLNNLEMVKSAVQQKRVPGISRAMETVFSFGPGTGPTFDGLLAPKGGKRKTSKTRSKRQRGGTPEPDSQLIDAIRSSDLPRAEALLNAGANIDSNAHGSTALVWASHRGNKEIVRMLLYRGANVNASMSDGNTALMWATNSGNEEIVRMLLDRGATVNASNSYGNTALSLASSRENTELVKMLLKAGANVNASDVDGETALIWATIRGNKGIVQMLLDAGANVNASGVDGKTALMMARQMRNQEIVQMIETHKTHIERKKDLNNLEMVKSAVQQKRVPGISRAMETVFSFGPGTGPTFDGLLAPKGGKRKTRKTRKSRSKRQRAITN
jgi:ankyrin repeat protein